MKLSEPAWGDTGSEEKRKTCWLLDWRWIPLWCKKRPSARALVINSKGEVLLFRFEHKDGPLSGSVFWATPGGGLEENETYEEAARRELFEEVGLEVEDLGAEVAQRTARFVSPEGEMIEADERYFLIKVDEHEVSSQNWTRIEQQVMVSHRWWQQSELRATSDQIWPENLADILGAALISRT